MPFFHKISNFHDLSSVFIFIIGACIGSFLCLCAERIPQKKSIVTPRSHCQCGTLIPWYLNLPIISWCCLRGKTRCCRSPIPGRYLVSETMIAGLFSALWALHEPREFLIQAIFVSLLWVISLIDLDTLEIPDILSLGGILIALLSISLGPRTLLSSSPKLWPCLSASVRGILNGSSLLLWIAILGEKILKRDAIGFGDIKLIGCIGAFIGTRGAIFAIFGGSCFVTPFLLLQILYRRWRHHKPWEAYKEIPFGPILSLGAMIYILGGQNLLKAYTEHYCLFLK